MKRGMYEQNGIAISDLEPQVGDKVEIVYSGLLKKSGARNVKLHLGYNERWEDSQYIEMNLSDNIFMATIPLKREGVLNFAFTDPVGNWDNNSGANYSVRIAGKRSVMGGTPMTGPYDKKPAVKRSAKSAVKEKTNEETAPPVKKTRAAASKTADTAAMRASPPSPATPQDTGASRGRVKGEAKPVIMPEETTGTRRGPGRKKKEP